MVAAFPQRPDDHWKDYPTAFNLEWFSQRQPSSLEKPPYGSLILKLLEAQVPETLHAKILARLAEERKPLSLKHPEAQHWIQKSLDFERKVIRQLTRKQHLTYDHYVQEHRFWLKATSGKPILSGWYNVLLLPFGKQYGIILQHYFTHRAPPPAENSRELAVLATIAYATLKVKRVWANSLWVPENQVTTVLYTADQLHTLHEHLQMDLKRFQPCDGQG